jgi:hypothetical protein
MAVLDVHTPFRWEIPSKSWHPWVFTAFFPLENDWDPLVHAGSRSDTALGLLWTLERLPFVELLVIRQGEMKD